MRCNRFISLLSQFLAPAKNVPHVWVWRAGEGVFCQTGAGAHPASWTATRGEHRHCLLRDVVILPVQGSFRSRTSLLVFVDVSLGVQSQTLSDWTSLAAGCGSTRHGPRSSSALSVFQTQTDPAGQSDFHTKSVLICVCICVYIYIYIHTCAHTHTHVGFYGLRGLSIGVMVFILYKLYVLLPYTYPTPKLSPHRRRCISTFPQKNSFCMIYKCFKLWGHWKCPHKSPSPCNTYVIPMSLYKFVSS